MNTPQFAHSVDEHFEFVRDNYEVVINIFAYVLQLTISAFLLGTFPGVDIESLGHKEVILFNLNRFCQFSKWLNQFILC